MNDEAGRYARLRYTATGALAALAAAGAIAGAVALAATPPRHRHAAVVTGSTTKTSTSPVPAKNCAPQPPVNQQPFFNAVQQLVDNGTITATEGQVVDSQIADGTLDTDTLASRGFTSAQLEAVQAALANTKRALAGGAATRNRPGVRQKKP